MQDQVQVFKRLVGIGQADVFVGPMDVGAGITQANAQDGQFQKAAKRIRRAGTIGIQHVFVAIFYVDFLSTYS